MVALVAMFATQTFLVYSDRTGRKLPPLSDQARAGRAIWLEHNCQACHQFYGFGGFLGPDLTNAAGRLDRARLDHILTEGAAQMPPFGLSEDQISAVAAYFGEMDRTGVGQARAPRPDLGLFAAAVREALAPDDAEVARGAELFLTGACTACHAALSARRIGSYLAPDLSLSVDALGDREILTVLESGRPAKGMPPTGLSAEQRQAVLVFLGWLADNRRALLDRALEGQETGIPWWEFR